MLNILSTAGIRFPFQSFYMIEIETFLKIERICFGAIFSMIFFGFQCFEALA